MSILIDQIRTSLQEHRWYRDHQVCIMPIVRGVYEIRPFEEWVLLVYRLDERHGNQVYYLWRDGRWGTLQDWTGYEAKIGHETVAALVDAWYVADLYPLEVR